MSTDMKIKSIAPWFGGKRTMAQDIIEQLGPHTQYFEPFSGSYAVILAKKPSQKETICDLHGDATNLGRVIQNESIATRLYERASRTQFAEGILKDARDVLSEKFDFENRDPDRMLDRAYWFFIASWMGMNGCAGTKRVDYSLATRYTKGGGSPSVRWHNAIDSMPAWCKRLAKVVILNRDSFDVMNKFEDCRETVIYCDPPYFKDTRSGYKKGAGEYLHEFNHGLDHRFLSRGSEPDLCEICGKKEADHKSDHIRLVDQLNLYKAARIVVSYYDHPWIRELYQGWTIIEKTMVKQLHATAGHGAPKSEAPEILLINGPAFHQPRSLFN